MDSFLSYFSYKQGELKVSSAEYYKRLILNAVNPFGNAYSFDFWHTRTWGMETCPGWSVGLWRFLISGVCLTAFGLMSLFGTEFINHHKWLRIIRIILSLYGIIIAVRSLFEMKEHIIH